MNLTLSEIIDAVKIHSPTAFTFADSSPIDVHAFSEAGWPLPDAPPRLRPLVGALLRTLYDQCYARWPFRGVKRTTIPPLVVEPAFLERLEKANRGRGRREGSGQPGFYFAFGDTIAVLVEVGPALCVLPRYGGRGVASAGEHCSFRDPLPSAVSDQVPGIRLPDRIGGSDFTWLDAASICWRRGWRARPRRLKRRCGRERLFSPKRFVPEWVLRRIPFKRRVSGKAVADSSRSSCPKPGAWQACDGRKKAAIRTA